MNTNDLENYLRLIGEGRRNEAEEIREKSIPNSLIKHIGFDGSETDELKLTTLENNELWFSNVSEFNDPYEFKGMVINRRAFQDAGYPDEVIDKFNNFLEMKEFGVACLSAVDIDYLPMWAYYTNNYQGYVIEFDVLDKRLIHQVIYEPNRIPIAKTLLYPLSKVMEADKLGVRPSFDCDKSSMLLMQNLVIKGRSWEHEKEYRIVWDINQQKGMNLKLSDLGLKVRRIIAGINCCKEHLERLNSISNKIGCGNIYISYLSETKYGLEIKEYDSSIQNVN